LKAAVATISSLVPTNAISSKAGSVTIASTVGEISINCMEKKGMISSTAALDWISSPVAAVPIALSSQRGMAAIAFSTSMLLKAISLY